MLAFLSALAFIAKTNSQYSYYESLYYDYYENNDNNDNKENNKNQNKNENSYYYYLLLSSTRSSNLKIAAIYTASLALIISLFGSMSVLGFMSPKGRIMRPCCGTSSSKKKNLRLGVLMGFLFMLSNLTLICAAIFGDLHVQDYFEHKQNQAMPSYAVEETAFIFAILCAFLAITYMFLFGLIITFYSSFYDEDEEYTNNVQSTIPGKFFVVNSNQSY